MTRIVIALFLLLPLAGISQTYINKSRATVKKELTEYSRKNNNLETSITETDSSIVLLVRDPRTLKADFIYGFDRSGKCNSEKTVAWCDSCSAKFLRAALARKKYAWVKLNENQYISKFSEKMMIELPGDNKDFSFTILRMDWSKILYDLLKNK